MNTLVVPGGKMGLAMELIMMPLVQRLIEREENRLMISLSAWRGASVRASG